MSFKTKWIALQMQKYVEKHPKVKREEVSEEDYESCMDEWHQKYFEKRRELWSIEIEDAKAKAYLKAVQDAQAAVIRQRIQEKDFTGMPELQELMGQIKNKRGNGGNIQLNYFVTVNCKPDVQLGELKKKVEKYVRRKMVTKAEYVFEQRGAHEGEMGKGLHAHILVQQRGDTFDGAFKVNTRNTFKTLVGNPETHVDIRPVKESFKEDKRAYMKGVKTQEGKAEKVAIDRVWRVNNNLKDYYTHENGRLQEEDDNASDSPTQAEDDASQGSSAEVLEAQ